MFQKPCCRCQFLRVKMADKYDKLMTELRGMVKCPVCLSIPEEGPIPSCPRGHLVCQPCHHGMIEGKLSKCPTCREPMGKTFSLLAKKLIESMDNNCTNEGCSKIFLNQELTKHIEELCEFRKVRCPGRNPYCEAEIPMLSTTISRIARKSSSTSQTNAQC